MERKHVAVAAIFAVLLCMQSARVEADCNLQNIVSKLATCLNVINSPPDPKGQCCVQLRAIHDTEHPDPACICSVMTQPAVQAVGLTKQKAASFIAVCVSPNDVPSCLAG